MTGHLGFSGAAYVAHAVSDCCVHHTARHQVYYRGRLSTHADVTCQSTTLIRQLG